MLLYQLIDIPDRWSILRVHRRKFGMKNPVYDQIQERKVKARLRMLQHSQRVSGRPRDLIPILRTARDTQHV